MKRVLIYLLMLALPMIGMGQKKDRDTIAYKRDDVVIRIMDTLYAPADTARTTSRYEFGNTSPKKISFRLDYHQEVFVPNKGWERIDFDHEIDSLKKIESLRPFFGKIRLLDRGVNMPLISMLPFVGEPGWESRIYFLEPDLLIYKAGKQYRIVKYFYLDEERTKVY